MRTHSRLLAVVLASILFGLGLAFVAVPRTDAQGGCANTYVVKPGDWLTLIASRNNTTLQELVRLNPGLRWNLNLIYPGQVLCLPATLPPQPVSHVSIAFEITHQYPSPRSNPVILGKRSAYAVMSAEIVTQTEKQDAVLNGSAPAAVIVENVNVPGYRLYEIGDPKLIASTLLTPTMPLDLPSGCNASSPATVFDAMQAMTTTFSISAERDNGLRIPLEITGLGKLPNVAAITSCALREQLVAVLFRVPGNDRALRVSIFDRTVFPPGPWPWPIPCYWFWGCCVTY